MAGQYSKGTLISAAATNAALTDFINALFDNHGASAGDYLVLRNNYDTNMSNYDDWIFNTGSASTNQPTLTLTTAAVIPEPSALLVWSLGLLGLIGWRRRRAK